MLCMCTFIKHKVFGYRNELKKKKKNREYE